MLHVAEDIFADYNSVIYQQPDGKRKRHQADNIACKTHKGYDGECSHHDNRQSGYGDDSIANVTYKQEYHQCRQYRTQNKGKSNITV